MCPGRDMSQVGGEVEEVHISMRHGGMEPSTQPGPDAGHWNVRWSQPQRFRTFYRETKGGTRFDLTVTSLQVSELRRCVLRGWRNAAADPGPPAQYFSPPGCTLMVFMYPTTIKTGLSSRIC